MSDGFDIWYDHQCIHEERGYSVESTEDLYGDVLLWWNGDCDDGSTPDDYLVKLFCNGEEEELTLKEIMEIEGV